MKKILINISKNIYTEVSDKDYKKYQEFAFRERKGKWNSYAECLYNKKWQYLHRLIAKAPPDKEVDHVDGNGLNNVRNNLRLCSRSENSANKRLYKNNKSGHRGISFNKRLKKWEVQLKYKGKQYYLGLYKEIESAVKSYNKKAKQIYGKFYNSKRSSKH